MQDITYFIPDDEPDNDYQHIYDLYEDWLEAGRAHLVALGAVLAPAVDGVDGGGGAGVGVAGSGDGDVGEGADASGSDHLDRGGGVGGGGVAELPFVEHLTLTRP